ncbi:MAG TPA: hypothetical protein VIL34_08675 [Actinopolymorphaceae bacterium]|jgi:hypothetical protein
MKHTMLTVRNFAGLAVADFLIGSISSPVLVWVTTSIGRSPCGWSWPS